MEWDDVVVTGLLQQFETAAVASIVELRKRHWKECTDVINDVRKLIAQLRSDFESGLNRVNSEKANMVKEIEKCNCMIEGKELEILGLRRQLKSVHMSKTLCKKCDCEVLAHETQTVKYANEADNPKKRTRFNLSISTSLESMVNSSVPPEPTCALLHRRPSEKRLCLATKDGQLAVDVVKPKIKKKEVPYVPVETQNNLSHNPNEDSIPVGPVADASPDRLIENKRNLNHRGRERDFGSPYHIGIANFSPPSQTFDASLAIREAVNHLDLANYEPSVIAPLPFEKPKHLKSKGGSRQAQVHKRTCRHYQPKAKEVGILKVKPRRIVATDILSDATGADLTFPSISPAADAPCVVAPPEKSLMPPPLVPHTYSTRVTRRTSKQPSIDVLPSVGRSPTSQRNIETQLESGQDEASNERATLGLADASGPGASETALTVGSVEGRPTTMEELNNDAGYSEGNNRTLSLNNGDLAVAAPSTPEGFWSVGNLGVASPTSEDAQQTMGPTIRRLRRRRPLNFPKLPPPANH